jgi:pimeloyl-ACP methyl ester carboxylesterase
MTVSTTEQLLSAQSDTQRLASDETIVRANGVDLCAQTFGDAADPAILLIHGAGASMLDWGDGFCERLASDSRFVIRYDHRDTGRSVSYEPGAPPYTLPDLAADATGLLDAFALDSAHLLGRSMGGALAMLAALEHPSRVSSLTLVGTSPGGSDLSPMSEAFLAYVMGAGTPDASDRDAVIDHVVGLLRAFAGSESRHFDEAAARDLVGRDVDRTVNVASSLTNHFVIDTLAPIRDRLGAIAAPTLVIHGVNDPVFPLDHGLALAKEIPDARLLTLEQTGHELPAAVWDIVIPAVVQHTSARRENVARG